MEETDDGQASGQGRQIKDLLSLGQEQGNIWEIFYRKLRQWEVCHSILGWCMDKMEIADMADCSVGGVFIAFLKITAMFIPGMSLFARKSWEKSSA